MFYAHIMLKITEYYRYLCNYLIYRHVVTYIVCQDTDNQKRSMVKAKNHFD